MPTLAGHSGHHQQIQMNPDPPSTIRQIYSPGNRRRAEHVASTRHNTSSMHRLLTDLEQTTGQFSSIPANADVRSDVFKLPSKSASEQKIPLDAHLSKQPNVQKKKTKSFRFENTFVQEDEFQEAEDESETSQPSQKLRRYRAPFDDDTRAKVAQVRALRACWHCAVRRVGVCISFESLL